MSGQVRDVAAISRTEFGQTRGGSVAAADRFLVGH